MIQPRIAALAPAAALAVSLSACAFLRPNEVAVDREDLSLTEPEAHVPIYWHRSLPPCGFMAVSRISGPTRASLRFQAVKAGGNAVVDAGHSVQGARSRMTLYSRPSTETYWGTVVRLAGKCRP